MKKIVSIAAFLAFAVVAAAQTSNVDVEVMSSRLVPHGEQIGMGGPSSSGDGYFVTDSVILREDGGTFTRNAKSQACFDMVMVVRVRTTRGKKSVIAPSYRMDGGWSVSATASQYSTPVVGTVSILATAKGPDVSDGGGAGGALISIWGQYASYGNNYKGSANPNPGSVGELIRSDDGYSYATVTLEGSPITSQIKAFLTDAGSFTLYSSASANARFVIYAWNTN